MSRPKRFDGIGLAESGFSTYARSFLNRGRLYEGLGDADKAIAAYDEFVRRWKDADAVLQPQVTEARSAAARLRDNPESGQGWAQAMISSSTSVAPSAYRMKFQQHCCSKTAHGTRTTSHMAYRAHTTPKTYHVVSKLLRIGAVAICTGATFVATPATSHAQGGRGATKPVPKLPAPVAKAPAKVSAPAAKAAVSTAGAWAMPDAADLVERVIRRIVTQDKPGAVPINDFRQRAFGRAATLAAVRSYLGRDMDLPASVYASVTDWADSGDKLPVPDCVAADSTCASPSTVWLAVTKFEKGDLPREMNVWYTTSFIAKPHDQLIISRYAFCERWLRVDGTWRYDGFIRVVSG